MAHETNVEREVRNKERKIRNIGRRLRDSEREQEPYPKRINRLDILRAAYQPEEKDEATQ